MYTLSCVVICTKQHVANTDELYASTVMAVMQLTHTHYLHCHHTTTTTVLRPFFRDHPGKPVPEENFWTLWCKGKINRSRHTDHPAGAT